MTVGLVLGGGGARGAFQAGALAALGAGGLVPDFVLGTSIGAINALGTTKLPPAELVARPTIHPWPVLILTAALPKMRQHVVTITGKPAATQLQWLLASSAIPRVYPKVNIADTHYVDGGMVNDLPVDVAHDLGATHIISIGAGGLGPKPKVATRLHLDVPKWAPHILDFRQKPRPRLMQAGWQMAQQMMKTPEFKALTASRA